MSLRVSGGASPPPPPNPPRGRPAVRGFGCDTDKPNGPADGWIANQMPRSHVLMSTIVAGRSIVLTSSPVRARATSRRFRRVPAALIAVGVVLSLGSTAVAAPIGALKQFRVPTANSQPRAITNGSDGNRWFTEGTELTGAPAKIARITPAGVITEIAPDVDDGCNFCIITDIA